MKQLSLFDLEPNDKLQVEAIVAQVEAFEEAGQVKTVFQVSSDALFAAFADMLVYVLAGPSLPPSMAESTALHRGAIGLERTRSLLVAIREAKDLEAQGDMEQAWTRLVNLVRADRQRLTDREVCIMFVDVSLEVGPMNRWATEEYYRAFAASYGPVMTAQILGGEVRPIRYDWCYGLRQFSPKLMARLPRITNAGIELMNTRIEGAAAWLRNARPAS